jgi:hypothetical protein
VKGMAAGLLWQPRKRGLKLLSVDQMEIKRLHAKVVELEQMVRTQQKLIEVIKSMPGRSDIDEGKHKREKSFKDPSRGVVEKRTKGESEAGSQSVGPKHAHDEILEAKL